MTSSLMLHGCALCVLLLSIVVAEAYPFTRHLLQSSKELAELEREENALEEHNIHQATLNREQAAMLTFGSEKAETLLKKFQKGTRKIQVKLFSDLWENAEGVTIVKALAMLIDLNPKKEILYFEIISDSMDVAEDNGYGLKVSEALYNAVAVTDSSADHYHLLNALLYRMKAKNSKKKGEGCEYIEFLFSDAEIWALDDGRAQQYFRGFDNTNYLPLVECFLPECKGSAAKCCGSSKAVSTGMCGCKVINKKKGTVQCDHNLFWTAPRTIWLCGLSTCEPDEKCLCPKAGSTIVKPKDKKSTSKDKDKKQTKKAEEKSTSKDKKQAKKAEEKSTSKDKKQTKKAEVKYTDKKKNQEVNNKTSKKGASLATAEKEVNRNKKPNNKKKNTGSKKRT